MTLSGRVGLTTQIYWVCPTT